MNKMKRNMKKIKGLTVFIHILGRVYRLYFTEENLANIKSDLYHRTIIAAIFPVWVFFIYCCVELGCTIQEIRAEDAQRLGLNVEKVPMMYYFSSRKEFDNFLERVSIRYGAFLKREMPKFIITTILSILGFNVLVFLILNVLYRL